MVESLRNPGTAKSAKVRCMMQTLKQELVTLPHDHCVMYSDHAVQYIASRRLEEKSASIERHGHYDKEPEDLKFGTHKPHISLVCALCTCNLQACKLPIRF